MFALWLFLCVPPDVNQLADPQWKCREWCELRCRMWWPMMLPNLHHHESQSEDAEFRVRCGRVLEAHREQRAELRATEALTSPFAPNINDFWYDEQLRERVFRQAIVRGVPLHLARGVLPSETDRWFGWWCQKGPVVMCYESLMDCRNNLNVWQGFPFRQP